MNLTPKERGATDLIDLSIKEQTKLLGGVRSFLGLAQSYSSELLMKALFEVITELYPQVAELPLEQRGAFLMMALSNTGNQFLQIGHDCLMPDCDCGGEGIKQ